MTSHASHTSNTSRTTRSPQQRPAALYLLQRRDGQRFKIGWSFEPLERLRSLPEYYRDELDLESSNAVWLPTPERARQFERSLHRGLQMYRVNPGHELDGHTEWFRYSAYRSAVRMIAQMPVALGAVQAPPLVPLLSDPAEHEDATLEGTVSAVVRTAQDVLWAMEDMLLRIAGHCPITLHSQGDHHRIRLGGLRHLTDHRAFALRMALLDADRYRWSTGTRSGSFVNVIEYDGEDLLLELAQPRQVRAWSDSGLWYQMLALLDRLRILSARQVLPQRPSTPPRNVFTHPEWIRKTAPAPKEPRG
jgi:hypothetical protein